MVLKKILKAIKYLFECVREFIAMAFTNAEAPFADKKGTTEEDEE